MTKPIAEMDTLELADAMEEHVEARSGLSRDPETGEINLPNGAWAMMLRAAKLLRESDKREAEAYREALQWDAP